MRIVVVSTGLALWLGVIVVAQNAIQDIPLTPANVHWGYYDAKLKPIAKIASGLPSRIETMVAAACSACGWRASPSRRFPTR